ncbi:MAG: M20/M25/M40 family metallo-hydrolase [Spirochaetales bacterium]|nr:M20/M25/M40 family metallo-hydrolase [Spirochaetales bacterium]
MFQEKVLNRFKTLQQARGFSGTDGEREIADLLFRCFEEHPYFKENRENLVRDYIPDDPFGRFNISAFYRSLSPSGKTIIFSGHMDVVELEGFGHLESLAFDYEAYTERVGELNLSEEALCDLESGEWIFGRGTADMRMGLAMALELMFEYMEKGDFQGNILFLAVAGEESNSEGMRHSLHLLNFLKNRYGLSYRGLFLFESFLEDRDEPDSKFIHIGACGKIMPFFLVSVENGHAGVDGNPVDCASTLSRIILEMYSREDLITTSRGKTAPVPVCLKFGDLKQNYSASIPAEAVAYFNLIYLENNTDALLESLVQIGKSVLENVYLYEEVYELAKKNAGDDPEKITLEILEEMKNSDLSIQDAGISLAARMLELAQLEKPAVLIGFLPPSYLPGYPEGRNGRGEDLREIMEEVSRFARESFSEKVIPEDYYMGVSDLSFLAGSAADRVIPVERNTPAGSRLYPVPYEILEELNIPGVVIGLRGRDFHTSTERLHLGYSLGVVPELHRYAIGLLINKE